MWADDFGEISVASKRKRRKIDNTLSVPKTLPAGEPTTIDDLATHSKKIAEVKGWLEWAGSSPKILLITGPTGSAKTVTLKVVARSLSIDVQEWVNPVDKIEFKHDDNWLEPTHYDSTSYFEPKQLDKFENFAFRGSRYQTLFATSKRRILLVEDFPNHFIWKPSTFLEFLSKYASSAMCPIVFIVTDDDKLNLNHKLFPNSTLMAHQISQIKFNAVSTTGLMKVLNKHDGAIGKDALKQIAASCNGDIRTALASLNFLQIDNFRPTKKTAVDKDVTTDFYRTLGRVLYPKFKEKPSDGRKFLYDVFEIASHYDNTFLLMLQENFVNYFGRLDDVIVACELLSECDLLATGDENLMKHSGLVCVSGLMLANKHQPVQKKFAAMNRSRWSGKSMGMTAETTRTYPQFAMTSRVACLDVLPYMKLLPEFTTVLTHSDANRLPVSVRLTKTVSMFRAPPPPCPVSEKCDDELTIEEFDD